MKASELLKRIEKLLLEHGDVECLTSDFQRHYVAYVEYISDASDVNPYDVGEDIAKEVKQSGYIYIS